MLLGLRKVEGIPIQETNQKFDTNIIEKFQNTLEKLKRLELITVDNCIRLTDRGLDFANIVWEEFV